MSRLTATVRERDGLLQSEVAEMYALFADYYECTSPALFEADLSEKSHAILMHSETRLCGFSTLALIDIPSVASFPPPSSRALFSGDTIIQRDYWGEQTLALEFCRFAGRMKAQRPAAPLYWFLISKGYRTYRYLHVFSKRYWPSFRCDSDAQLQTVLNIVARIKFGNSYDVESGLIRFPFSQGHLREPWAGVRENLHGRPEIDFFLRRNPRYAAGEELACITLLDEGNLRSIARSAFVEGLIAGSAHLDCSMEHAVA